LSLELNSFADWEPDSIQKLYDAEIVWREFLLRKRPHPGRFRQQLLPLDQITGGNSGLVPNINRYLMRAIQMDLCRGRENIFTYSKLGRFIVIGCAHEPNLQQWQGTAVNANGGVIGPREYVVPRALGSYLNEQAQKISASLSSVSERQKAKIDSAFRVNIDQFVGSDAFSALKADALLFGEDAIWDR